MIVKECVYVHSRRTNKNTCMSNVKIKTGNGVSACSSALSVLRTSVLITRDLFPKLSRKCRGDSIVPNSCRSPNFSLSVSVVAEIPARGPRLGREPAVTDGSGICPGIVSDSVVTTAGRQREGEGRQRVKHT